MGANSHSQPRSRGDRHEFRYLFPKEDLSVEALEWAEELKTRFQQARDEIQERVGEDRDAFNEELGKLYDRYRAEINQLLPTPQERFEGAAALWYNQHTRPKMDRHRCDCLLLAKQMDITFALQPDYELSSEALPRDAYVLIVPFGAEAIRWKETLERKGIQFDAMIHPQLPVIEFALKDISPHLVKKLEAKFGQNINDLDALRVPEDLRIVPPADHIWAESRQDSGVGALAYNLFTEEVCQQLQAFQSDEIKILGIRHNNFADENFATKQWRNQTVSLQLGVFELPESHPEYYRYNGTAIVQMDDKNLGTFSPDTPKLAIGSSFEATLRPEGSSVVLKLNLNSIQLPESALPSSESVQSSDGNRNQWRKELFEGLVMAVGTTYEQCSGGARIAQFKLGEQWMAYVQPTGDFIIRNESKQTICRGNLHTGDETVPLAEEYADELERMLLKQERSPQPDRPRSPHSSPRQFSL
ncbi:hypothetical protein NDA01_30465 [Trichocoleus desertorum AS-A10]|uniref:hypothetical protein n=1 Tax=Trichocoleus desertorum TaxID=1481672 RepID=UPI00329A5D7E